jgi:molybdopterin synthase catalytic subunit
VKVTVRCFASVRELLGEGVFVLEVPDGTTLEALKQRLVARAPDLARLPFAWALNREYADPQRVLQDGDEVALIPPISGGAPDGERFAFALQAAPLDPRALERAVRTDRDGAVVSFTGVTRDHHDGRQVVGLAYEAYPEMAAQVVETLLAEAGERFAITRARVAHRVGEVPVGEASIAVVVSAPHRGAAFDACRWLMDRIKAQAPIFKKERCAAGGARWVGELPQA